MTDRAAVTRAVLLGVLGVATILIATAYAEPAELGFTRAELTGLSAVALGLSGALALLPWKELYERGIAEPIADAYILITATLLPVGVALGAERPTRILWVAPLILALSAFMARRWVHAVVTVMMLGLFVQVIWGRPVTALDIGIRVSVLLGIATTAGYLAELWRRSVIRETRYRAMAERRTDLLAAMGDATAELSATGREDLLSTLTSTAASMGADLAVVCLNGRDRPSAVVSDGVRAGAAMELKTRFAEVTDTVVVDDCLVDDEQADLYARTGLASLLCIPIAAGGETRGLLLAGARKTNAFDRTDVETLQMLARSAAVGLAPVEAESTDDQEILALLSHELRGPVTAIAGLTETLEIRWDQTDDDVRRALLSRVRSNATTLDVTLSAMRSLVQLEQPADDLLLEPFDIATLVGDTVDRLEPLLAGHHLAQHLDAPALVETNRALVERVVENLLTNARRHTPPGTTIIAEVRAIGDAVEVAIADDGPGMSQDEVARMRTPYLRGAASSGLGIGLSLCDRILRNLGAELRIDSTAGVGSRFHFRLPRLDAIEGRRAER